MQKRIFIYCSVQFCWNQYCINNIDCLCFCWRVLLFWNCSISFSWLLMLFKCFVSVAKYPNKIGSRKKWQKSLFWLLHSQWQFNNIATWMVGIMYRRYYCYLQGCALRDEIVTGKHLLRYSAAMWKMLNWEVAWLQINCIGKSMAAHR